MNAIEQGGKVATTVVESLRSQPLVLALVVINVIFLISIGYLIHLIGQSTLRKDQLLAQISKDCIVIPKEKVQ